MTQVSTTQSNKPATLKSFFSQDKVKLRFQEILKDKSTGFLSSLLQISANNSTLANADPISIYNAALMAATLDLPINQNLGFAWIVPYKRKTKDASGQWTEITEGQFQIGWRGILQLALRTGQYKAINAVEVYENQFKSFNSLTEELDADFGVQGVGKVVGYCAYFKLINGFEKTTYWSIEKVKSHASKYSQTYNKKNSFGKMTTSPWNDEAQFDSMALKTVLKNTLSKWGILSIEMQKGLQADQAVIKIEEGTELEYVDHEEVAVNPESDRLIALINSCSNVDDLGAFEVDVDALNDAEVRAVYIERYESLKGSDEEKK
jgi:recombination protein RecT